MGANRPWNGKVTDLKTIKMMLVRSRMANFKMIVRADWNTCCFCMLPPPAAYKRSCPLIISGGELAFGQVPTFLSPNPAMPVSKQSKPSFHQPVFVLAFCVASQTPVLIISLQIGLPRWCSGKEFACQSRRCKIIRFDPWVRKIPWSRKWQPTPVFLPGKYLGQRKWGHKESDMTEQLNTHHKLEFVVYMFFLPDNGIWRSETTCYAF